MPAEELVGRGNEPFDVLGEERARGGGGEVGDYAGFEREVGDDVGGGGGAEEAV